MLQGSILQKLAKAHQQGNTALNLGVYYKNTLISLCHALEDFILESESQPIVIAAFQQGKWYLQEAERYGELAQNSSDIAIMATLGAGFSEHSTTNYENNYENVTLVNLPEDDPVAQEWHLMILSPKYTAMVLCQELSLEDYGPSGQPENDLERKFYGFWTFEPALVRETVELAIAHLQAYDPTLGEKLSGQVERMIAEFGHCQRDDLNAVVSKVVGYLQDGHSDREKGATGVFTSALQDNLMSNEMQAFLRMAQLIDQADATNPNAASEVASLSEAMGQILDLPAWQIKRLRLAGLLHRLAPLKGATEMTPLKSKPQQEMLAQQGLLPKASVLRVMPQLQAIAKIITHQSEQWDGSGQPEGLSYDDIPLESRIIALISEFQQQVTQYQSQQQDNPLAQALAHCEAEAGKRFDPKLVESLTLLVMGLQQGMSIEFSQPKIASGIWLLDETEQEMEQLVTSQE
ncbi:DICT sensory domain-containing protein [Spirulina sp. CS-785/01]|uniref:DICT sensory domain-containing protein n=1 Tax=Spirulina sp. CS-785/01 TaxID=3021716 RepID=UPI00232D3CB1|nr:DICT sensory domain-containing protein [Spirulina sp. CS-785/01]MDB9315765.1 DICT sensory domain-containing protein [Spirulina sp. CS-785/01]